MCSAGGDAAIEGFGDTLLIVKGAVLVRDLIKRVPITIGVEWPMLQKLITRLRKQ